MDNVEKLLRDEVDELSRLLEGAEFDLINLAAKVWLHHSTIRADGSRVAAGDSLAKEAERLLRKHGKLNERGRLRGRFTWENVQ